MSCYSDEVLYVVTTYFQRNCSVNAATMKLEYCQRQLVFSQPILIFYSFLELEHFASLQAMLKITFYRKHKEVFLRKTVKFVQHFASVQHSKSVEFSHFCLLSIITLSLKRQRSVCSVSDKCKTAFTFIPHVLFFILYTTMRYKVENRNTMGIQLKSSLNKTFFLTYSGSFGMFITSIILI